MTLSVQEFLNKIVSGESRNDDDWKWDESKQTLFLEAKSMLEMEILLSSPVSRIGSICVLTPMTSTLG